MSERNARLDPRLSAVLRAHAPLRYHRPPEGAPPYVRAASGVRRFAGGLAIVQDDAAWIAHVVGAVVGGKLEGRVEAWPFVVPGARVFSERLGNKREKPDLEACVVLGEGAESRFVALGSGSTPARERIVVCSPTGETRVIDAAALYARLRAETGFSGSELNVEGASVVGAQIRLFQRGNGAERGELTPVDATVDLDLAGFSAWLFGGGPLPELQDVRRYSLGVVEGARLGLTDAAGLPADFRPLAGPGAVAYLACAERSPDTYSDGEVVAARFGLIDADEVRDAVIVDSSGAPIATKLEGIEPARREGDAYVFHVVSDTDDPDAPAHLGELWVEMKD